MESKSMSDYFQFTISPQVLKASVKGLSYEASLVIGLLLHVVMIIILSLVVSFHLPNDLYISMKDLGKISIVQ